MSHYALMVWGPTEEGEFGGYDTAEENEAQFRETGRFNDRLRAEGHFVYAHGLASASASSVVDGRGTAPIITDGPYLESKEHIAGFWIIDVPDLDRALGLAAEGSRACSRRVEVRPMAGG